MVLKVNRDLIHVYINLKLGKVYFYFVPKALIFGECSVDLVHIQGPGF